MEIEYLKYAIVELTTECNLRCRHCYNWWKQPDALPRHQNSYKKAFRLLEYLLKHTSVENITFTGGEPTISERFAELVLHARLHGRRVTIITNGNGPTEVYRQLYRMQVNMLEVSIHSFRPEVHDRITDRKGSFDKAVQTLKEALSQGVKVTPVMVITSLNHADAAETLQFFHDLGIRSVMVNRYNIGGEGLKQEQTLSATAAQLRHAFGSMNEFAAAYPVRLFSGVCTPHCLLNPDDYPHIAFGSCSEDVYRRPLTFDIEGNLRLCNHSPVIVGNVFEKPLGDILNSAYVDEWADLELSFCTGCTRLKRCKGGCRAASEQVGLSLSHADPVIQETGLTPFL